MSLKSRKELERALKDAYSNVGVAEKKKLLDGFVEATGLHRKYAITLLKRLEESRQGLTNWILSMRRLGDLITAKRETGRHSCPPFRYITHSDYPSFL